MSAPPGVRAVRSGRPSAVVSGSSRDVPVTFHHALRRPNAVRKAAPVTVLEPVEPASTTLSTRPPHSPGPVLLTTVTELGVPIVGYAARICDAVIRTLHACTGFPWASHGSRLATRYGALPAAVQPPFEALNWVKAGAPP